MAGRRREPERLFESMFKRRFKSGHLFNSKFEERKACEYLLNLINSKFMKHKPKELFEFAGEVIGKTNFMEIVKQGYSSKNEEEDFDSWVNKEFHTSSQPSQSTLGLFESNVSALLSERIVSFSKEKNVAITNRLFHIQEAFNLTDEEVHIVTFFYLEETCPIIDEYLDGSNMVDFTNLTTFKSHAHLLLGLKRTQFLKAFTKGALFQADILDKKHSIGMSSWCIDYLSGIGEENLAHGFFTKVNKEPLAANDFDITKDEFDVLDSVIKSKKSQNILLYGSPGTGKSSFARALAMRYGKELYTIKIPEADDHKDRLRAIIATINLSSKDKSIILVDEADEILNSSQSFFFRSKTNKSWINNLLESHNKKIIWITNRSSEIDRSTMRRFSFSIEFKAFDQVKRLKVLKYELGDKGLSGYFEEEDLTGLCKKYNVDAGGIVNAISTLKIDRRIKKETALKRIETVLKSHERATGYRKKTKGKNREFGNYSLEGLNTSQNLAAIVSAINRFTKQKDNDSFRGVPSITALLHGMPGTGKTEFVYYLGNMLEKEVLLKRCSDIQSKWVGETEQNIASAFMEAQENNSILFFDEADSFLFPRKNANHSWEINGTNEILTQIENFRGIAIFATNNIDGLDHAALRRFRFKIEFKPLTPEGNVRFYDTIIKPLVAKGKHLSASELNSIKRICSLTPGDFAVVKDQSLFMEPDEVNHAMLIRALMNETRYREGNNKVIGFVNQVQSHKH